MSDIGKMLIGMGILLIVVGGILHFCGKFLPLEKLPGDISITGEHGSFYKPGVFQSVMWLAICTACLILVLCHYWHILIGNRVSAKLTGYSSLIAP
ncbi:MAG: DUF2905 domain-containing protein [Selenomonadaceae bacterium]|nr:DUF2905 domain-containing protein [Selenomonadaceae bacterium]